MPLVTSPIFRIRFCTCVAWSWRLGLIFSATLSSTPLLAATYTTPRRLVTNDIYELRRDGWSNPAGGGAYEGDVLPKTDANLGTSGDNRYFQRHNVARAWPTDVGYWFTGSDQHEGEPDPAGEQWVDYIPPFEILGPGRYAVDAAYRWSTNRASYPAVYRIHHALGTNEVFRDQRIGSPGSTIFWFSLGEFEMRPGSFVRVEDTGTQSITFSNMRFRLLAPAPRLEVIPLAGGIELRWPASAIGYSVEAATTLTEPVDWQQLFGVPNQDGLDLTVFVLRWNRKNTFGWSVGDIRMQESTASFRVEPAR